MELILNRPLQWFVCQLHANFVPLRLLFAHVDRATTGPRSLTGEIRKSLAGCEKLSVVSSTPIEYTLCEVTNKKDLNQLVYSYNHTYHSSLKRAPVEVNSENEQDVWLSLYGNMENVERKPCAFKDGDTVRISKAKMTFEKGSETNWTEELFTVSE
ncbi:hypothetical protein AVEN_25262-1 [Araneus ventricosus]|uniref:Uncharacterized protein n=1 Tax=Araneus ventricosus TaxID=182803 RepID=A0A4Y2PV35_ARAVE|nr:hypothetical protein AVEN_25262-1 [Araneus ventricosus]